MEVIFPALTEGLDTAFTSSEEAMLARFSASLRYGLVSTISQMSDTVKKTAGRPRSIQFTKPFCKQP